MAKQRAWMESIYCPMSIAQYKGEAIKEVSTAKDSIDERNS